jgi:N-acyl amino acid synthase of PEP-CTERM/exosortase system
MLVTICKLSCAHANGWRVAVQDDFQWFVYGGRALRYPVCEVQKHRSNVQQDLISALNEYFELVHADTDELRAQVFFLRYQVYVLETGFEREDECKSGLDASGQLIHWEEDEFDVRSDHYLLRHRRTGTYAATARLILPESATPESLYPIELHCPLDTSIDNPEVRRHLGEISRFAVSKMFKRRIGEEHSLPGVCTDIEVYFDEHERRVLPHISLGLFAAVMRMVDAHQVSHCYAVMEPALIRLLGRFGILFERIGPDVEYHGLRVPCLSTVDEALDNIKRVAPPVWELITNRGAMFHTVS